GRVGAVLKTGGAARGRGYPPAGHGPQLARALAGAARAGGRRARAGGRPLLGPVVVALADVDPGAGDEDGAQRAEEDDEDDAHPVPAGRLEDLHRAARRLPVRRGRQDRRAGRAPARAQPRPGRQLDARRPEDPHRAVSRRAAAVLIALVAALGLAPSAPAGAAPPSLRARSAGLVQPDTGDLVYARAPDQRRPMASTTKLMTALLTLERSNLDDVVPAVPYHPQPAESV